MPLFARLFRTSTHRSVANCPLSEQPQGALSAPSSNPGGAPFMPRASWTPDARGFFFATAQAEADPHGRALSVQLAASGALNGIHAF